jgi:cytosine permease
MEDDWFARLVLYGGMTASWILLTAFGFRLVTRTSSLMIIGFLLVLAWMMVTVLTGAAPLNTDSLLFASQMDAATLAGMGIDSDADKFVFALNLLVGPACALALNTAILAAAQVTAHAATPP